MTLIVSDVSYVGCCMVSDTSVATVNADGAVTKVCPRARKIDYLKDLHVGIGVWGNACISIGNHRVPVLQHVFEALSDLPRSTDLHTVARKLLTVLNGCVDGMLCSDGKLNSGIHLAGYSNNKPMLYHICPMPKHRLFQIQPEFPDLWVSRLSQMHMDNPAIPLESNCPPEYKMMYGTASGAYETQGNALMVFPSCFGMSPEDRVYAGFENGGFFHLRNGCLYPDCAHLLDDKYGGRDAVQIIRSGCKLEHTDPERRIRAYMSIVGSVVDAAIEEAKEDGIFAAAAHPLDGFLFNDSELLFKEVFSKPDLECSSQTDCLFL